MQYKLKKGQDSIQVTDGKFAGRKFFRGKIYSEIPPEEKHRFEVVPEPKPVSEPPAAQDMEQLTAEAHQRAIAGEERKGKGGHK